MCNFHEFVLAINVMTCAIVVRVLILDTSIGKNNTTFMIFIAADSSRKLIFFFCSWFGINLGTFTLQIRTRNYEIDVVNAYRP